MKFFIYLTFYISSASAAALESVTSSETTNHQQSPPYLALMPTLVSPDTLSHDLLKQILTSVNSIKDNKASCTKYQGGQHPQQINEEGVAKLVDVGGGYKLHIVAVKRVDWFHAMKFCKALGLQLVSLETKEKASLVQAYLGANGYNEYMWTSGIRLYDTWVWSAINEEFSYTGWHSSQPNKGNEYCVLVQPGFWADMVCGSTEYYGYICEPKY